MTLKVGDKVRAKGGAMMVSTVVETGRRGYAIKTRFDGFGEDRHGLWHEHELEKIEPEPKFKVGDRVRARETSAANAIKKGQEFLVTHIRPAYAPGESLLYGPGLTGVYACRFEKIEEEPPRPLGLQAGDKVVNLKTGREGLVLKGPISGDLKVYDQKPPIKDAVPAAALEEYEFHYPGTYDVWRRVTEKKKAQPW